MGLDQRDEMAEIPSEPIQPPTDQDIELASFRITDERIESRTPVCRSTDTTVRKFDGRPTSGFHPKTVAGAAES
jgi:hypothetical protein